MSADQPLRSADQGSPPDRTPPTCARCGTAAPSVPPPVGWSGGVERGRPHWVCPVCTRRDLRGIEAKLDESWW